MKFKDKSSCKENNNMLFMYQYNFILIALGHNLHNTMNSYIKKNTDFLNSFHYSNIRHKTLITYDFDTFAF